MSSIPSVTSQLHAENSWLTRQPDTRIRLCAEFIFLVVNAGLLWGKLPIIPTGIVNL